MLTAEYAENAEIFHEIRLSALCALGGEIRYHLLLDHYHFAMCFAEALRLAEKYPEQIQKLNALVGK